LPEKAIFVELAAVVGAMSVSRPRMTNSSICYLSGISGIRCWALRRWVLGIGYWVLGRWGERVLS
ncbi:MAG TPA: hypothetical protein VMI31_01005, partial [Fimbriimonadaceae bacterium]|nr:hypothetical protein [Fimbriimonadaceae bacterium]